MQKFTYDTKQKRCHQNKHAGKPFCIQLILWEGEEGQWCAKRKKVSICIFSQECDSHCSEMLDSSNTSPNSTAKELRGWTLACPSFIKVFYLMKEAVFWLEAQWKYNWKGEGVAERKKILPTNTVMGLENWIRYVITSIQRNCGKGKMNTLVFGQNWQYCFCCFLCSWENR